MRQNNAAVIAKAEPNVTKGGNIAKYNEIIGEDKTSTCAEFTFPKFEGTTGQEFIALQLCLNAEDFDGAKAKESKAVKDGAAAATEDDAPVPAANDMGAGAAAGDKSTGETEISAKPVATEGEQAKDKAAKDPKAAKDKTGQAANPTKPIYSPILDADVQSVGICNKVHPKTINVIQVLYIKSVTNAMV